MELPPVHPSICTYRHTHVCRDLPARTQTPIPAHTQTDAHTHVEGPTYPYTDTYTRTHIGTQTRGERRLTRVRHGHEFDSRSCVKGARVGFFRRAPRQPVPDLSEGRRWKASVCEQQRQREGGGEARIPTYMHSHTHKDIHTRTHAQTHTLSAFITQPAHTSAQGMTTTERDAPHFALLDHQVADILDAQMLQQPHIVCPQCLHRPRLTHPPTHPRQTDA
jgi:hypothetical protein